MWNCLLLGLSNIVAYRFRSFLTVSGMVLGVSSLVAISAIVRGMEQAMTEPLIAAGGIDKVWINESRVPSAQERLREMTRGLTFKDVVAIQQGAPLVRLVSPTLSLRSPMISYRGRPFAPSYCGGAWASTFELGLKELAQGRFFTDVDERFAHSVCIIGTGIRNALFGTPMERGREVVPLGEVILINGQPFTIVGMLKHNERERTRLAREKAIANNTWTLEKEAASLKRLSRWDHFWGGNHAVYVPIRTMKLKLRSGYDDGRKDRGLTQIGIKVFDATRVEEAMQQVRNVLLRTHGGIEDFNFNYFVGRMKDNIEKRTRDARVSGGMIAGMSLLVGGLGIMNIMLASIHQRVRELGVCKAIGASPNAIFLQILAEALVLTLVGILLGLLGAYFLIEILSYASGGHALAGAGVDARDSAGARPIIVAADLYYAITFSLGIGILAGLLPAMKAARLDPIQALRSG